MGVGAACAACCAVPLVGGAAALTTASTALAALGSTLLACADEFVPLAGVLLTVAAAGAGLVWWRRRAARKGQKQHGCGGVAVQAESEAPIACSLPPDARELRTAWIRRVTASGLLSHQLDGRTLRLGYRPEALPELQQIIAAERQCCPFLSYSLRRSGDGVQLTIEAPEGVGPDTRWLFDQFIPQGTMESKKLCGCATAACG